MHPRVSPAGQDMGRSAARLADIGQAVLQAAGVANISTPTLRADMCTTCACQRGSVPNGCLQTQLDFLKAAAEGQPFLCHAPRDGRICAGWTRVRAALVQNPLPQRVMDLLAKRQYSPPDEPETAHVE